jgi:hypothetical protein
MEDHRTLDEFGQGHAREESDDDHHPESEQSAGDEDSADHPESEQSAGDQEIIARDSGEESSPGAHPEAVDPPTTTVRWTPDGDVCERCDTVVKRRWRGDDAFVCAECKEW